MDGKLKTHTIKRKILLISVFLTSLFPGIRAHAQQTAALETGRLPEIRKLYANRDETFRDFEKIVQNNYRLVASGKQPALMFFRHSPDGDMTLIKLAARFNIRYETIATLNSIQSPDEQLAGRILVIPTVPGLFIVKGTPETALETVLREGHADELSGEKNMTVKLGAKEFIFLVNRKFSPTERLYFLDPTLTLPIRKDEFTISSVFGKRRNPFSGEWKNHNGIDLAAKTGTPVLAVKDGTAAVCIEGDPVFGNYVILSHDKGKMTSVYAHLSSISIRKNESVSKKETIGYVGSSGMATGPHLHFELRQGGIPADPSEIIRFN